MMIFKVIRVLLFMFRHMLSFAFRRAVRIKNPDADLDRIYSAWAAFVLKVFDAELSVEGRENIPKPEGRKLVIKRVLPHLSEDQEFLSMFLEEARLA